MKQHFTKKWLALIVALIMALGVVAVPVSADGNEVVSLVAQDSRVVENTNGSIWSTNGNEWFHYDLYGSLPVFTATLKDGTEITGSSWYFGEKIGINIDCMDEQDYENRWGLGKHEVYFDAGEFSGTAVFEIVESPIESIEVDPFELIEGVDGSWWEHYDTNGEFDGRYFHYWSSPSTVTVKMKDGKSYKNDAYKISQMILDAGGYSGEYFFEAEDGQDYDTPWGVGEHKVNVTFMNKSAECTVTVKQNDIVSFAPVGDTLEVTPYTTGWYDGHYIDDVYYGNTWYFYNPLPEKFTVTERSGQTFTGTSEELEERYDSYIRMFCDGMQSDYDHRWEEGSEHDVTLVFMGREAQIKVKVGATPVKSVTAVDSSVVEYTDGYYDGGWDEVMNDWITHTWYRYSLLPSKVTVEFKDGSEFTGTPDELMEKYDSPIAVNDPQDIDAQYGVGNYSVNASFMGVNFSYGYEITKDTDYPVTVTRVDFHDVEVEWNQRTFTDDGNNYYLYFPEFTVYFSNGRSVESEDGGAGVNHVFVPAEYDDGQLEEPWKEGSTHKVSVTFNGFKGEFNVKVLEKGAQRSDSPSGTAGDVNGDGSLNAKDVVAIMKFLVGKTPDKWNESAADYNGDGSVNAKDVVKLMKDIVAGKGK